MASEDMKAIRAAVIKRRGGLERATDEEILVIWRSLSPMDQRTYLGESATDAARTAAAGRSRKETA